MKIRFKKPYLSTAGRWKPGDELEVPERFGSRLIERGHAEEVKPKRATKPKGNKSAETAVDEEREKR